MFELCKITLDTPKQIWYNTNWRAMTVYRIQSRQNRTRGAYDIDDRMSGVRPDVVSRMHDAHSSWEDTEHPTARQDIGINRYIEDGEYCGCPSAASLLR